MLVERELAVGVLSAVAQLLVDCGILQRSNHRIRQTIDCRWVPRGENPVCARLQPVRDPANIEGDCREAVAPGLEADECKRLWPEARNDEQVRVGVQRVECVSRKPSVKRHLDLGLHSIRVLTNNPRKFVGLQGYGLAVSASVPLEIPPSETTRRYLKTKKDKLGHRLTSV